eukprot:SAG31_NODE_1749_length_7358_cov_6.713872_8_plen_72_part_00
MGTGGTRRLARCEAAEGVGSMWRDGRSCGRLLFKTHTYLVVHRVLVLNLVPGTKFNNRVLLLNLVPGSRVT